MMENNKRPLFLLEEKLTYKLRGVFIEISKKHGCLFKEKAYYKLICEEFKNRNIAFLFQPKITLHNFESSKMIDEYYPDFVVEDKIIIEVKAQGQIFNNHIDQLIKYLSSTKFELGFIVNFGTPMVQIERRIFTNNRKPFICDSSQISTDEHR